MLKKISPLCLMSLILVIAGAHDEARAHSCLHTRVKCKTFYSSNKAEFVHPHNQSGQYLNAKCFKTGGGLGFNVAEAFAHSSQHTNGNTHLNGWGWSAGFASYSWHASHGHCSTPKLLGSSHSRPSIVPPPEGADSQGAFGLVDVEVHPDGDDIVLEFLRGSRLQVDRRGLVRPTDESHSSITVHIREGAIETFADDSLGWGRLVLSVKGDGSMSLLSEGIFSSASLDQNSDVPAIAPASVTDNSDLEVVELEGMEIRVQGAKLLDEIEFDAFGFHDGAERDHGQVWEGNENGDTQNSR